MELLLVIATLCNTNGLAFYNEAAEKNLACQKYYIECYESKVKKLKDTIVFSQDLLIMCIKDKK